LARLTPVLLMALLCIAPPLITAQPYPVDVNVGSSTPRRFNIFQYWIEIKAYSSADIIVKAVIYVPGYGWSDWQKLWEGHMRVGEEKRVNGSFFIANDAGVGSVVVWCRVCYHTPDDYDVIAGKEYYGDLNVIYVAGSLPDPNVKRWAWLADYWKSRAEFWKDLYNSSLMWKDWYYELDEKYTALKRSFDAIANNYTKLKAEYNHLLVINEQLKQERDTLLGQVSMLQLISVLAALAGMIAGAVAMYIHQRRSVS